MLSTVLLLPLSRATLDYLAGVVRRHRRKIGSCWRKLNPGKQALLVLAHLRIGETFAALAGLSCRLCRSAKRPSGWMDCAAGWRCPVAYSSAGLLPDQPRLRSAAWCLG